MSGLFELERNGEWEEARKRCLAFSEMYPKWEFTPLVRARALAYSVMREGIDAVRPDLVALEKAGGPVGEQAGRLLWLHGSENRALLGSHVRGNAELYLDGKALGRSGSAEHFAVWPLELVPGKHEVVAEVTPGQMDPWFSLAIWTGDRILHTDAGWEIADQRPAAWPQTEAGAQWEPLRAPWLAAMLPRSTAWQFVPNVYVGAQSSMQLVRSVFRGGPRGEPRKVYLRRRFKVPLEDDGTRPLDARMPADWNMGKAR